MRILGLLLVSVAICGARSLESESNVNSRYTVESVRVSGNRAARLSNSLRAELDRIVGGRLDQSLLDRMALRLRSELRAENVAVHVTRGAVPGRVVVEFEMVKARRAIDFQLARLSYQSGKNFSGSLQATTHVHGNDLMAGIVTNGDDLAELYSGVETRVERKGLLGDRLSLRMDVDHYVTQWNSLTLAAAPGELYRSRDRIAPAATIKLAGPLTLTVGLTFDSLQPQLSAARVEASNALVNTLRYHQSWEDLGSSQQEVDAGYSLRAATRTIGSDFVYVRQALNGRYRWSRDRHTVIAEVLAGAIQGHAPLFDRFVLGNATLLRGWNRFEIAPRGGDRVGYGSLEYHYGRWQVFYDVGAVWAKGGDSSAHQSLGAGFRLESLLLAMAFPLRQNHPEPVFIAGMYF